jgi:hypothetical protein
MEMERLDLTPEQWFQVGWCASGVRKTGAEGRKGGLTDINDRPVNRGRFSNGILTERKAHREAGEDTQVM